MTKEKAMEHAIASMIRDVATEASGLERWKGAKVAPEPLEIYDINGTLLFYEFSVMKGKQIVGRIRASASKVLGHSVIASLVGPSKLNFEKARQQTTKLVLKKYKDAEIASMKIVCYSYPKMGIMAEVVNPKTKETIDILVVDAATYQIVDRTKGMWSMYGNIPQKERADRIENWEADEKLLELIREFAKKAKINIMSELTDKEMAPLKKEFFKVVVFLGPIEKRIPITLHGQQHTCWCAVATGQMLLRYHNYFYQQADIAVAMSTDPQPANVGTWTTADPCGTSNTGQVAGYESLSRNYLDAILDTSPTWQKAKTEIDADRPLKSGVQYPNSLHARACSGYRETFLSFTISGGIVIAPHFYLWINDPWPPNANNAFCNPQGGDEGWEEWDSILHTNFIYLHPCTGTMVCSD